MINLGFFLRFFVNRAPGSLYECDSSVIVFGDRLSSLQWEGWGDRHLPLNPPRGNSPASTTRDVT